MSRLWKGVSSFEYHISICSLQARQQAASDSTSPLGRWLERLARISWIVAVLVVNIHALLPITEHHVCLRILYATDLSICDLKAAG